jgi:alpha-amylase/alpha-mannosidase (GH57 family)
VKLTVGTYPIEPGQAVWVAWQAERVDGTLREGTVPVPWRFNHGNNSYWLASLGPFADGDRVRYRVHGRSGDAEVSIEEFAFVVGPKLHLALLWHMHQPLYKDLASKRLQGSYRLPWVRLHAIRDYYAMAALVAQHPEVHLTINLVPSLLWQIEDYVERHATDRALDLTLKPSKKLTSAEKAYILEHFFEAHWHNQIFPYPRYYELFQRQIEGAAFSDQDFNDLKMWFNLAWFAPELQAQDASMPDGSIVSLKGFVAQGAGFSDADIEQMVAQQYTIMRNIVPIHRALQDRGQIEVSTTPFYHPILPLVYDSNQATIDREGSAHPARFSYPEDARAQVRRAVEYYRATFGRLPRGMWPAEGAVSSSVGTLFAKAGIAWIATDRGVLQRSGRWGYQVDDPNVLCRPYRTGDGSQGISIFFRDTDLSDRIGFHYQSYDDAEQAAADFIAEIKARFAHRVDDPPQQVLSVILDGENAWSAYRESARPFLHALYRRLGVDPEIRTVTFAEFLEGNPARRVVPHPTSSHEKVYDLFCGSWIDEMGSRPGVDLGTWIGEPEEDRAWELLGEAREALSQGGASPESHPASFESLYAAEGSDWFWWYGDDQSVDHESEFDELFRTHVKQIYRGLGRRVPRHLSQPLVPRIVVWSFEHPFGEIERSDRLAIQTHCRGVLMWAVDDTEVPQRAELTAVGGVMAGIRRYRLTLGPFPPGVKQIRFAFRCAEQGCSGDRLCCAQQWHTVRIDSQQESQPEGLPGRRKEKH